MEERKYDLCIDRGNQVIQVADQYNGWSEVHPGTKIVMRILLLQEQEGQVKQFRCPRCKAWNIAGSTETSMDCQLCDGRFQVAEADGQENGPLNGEIEEDVADVDMQLIRNLHLTIYVCTLIELSFSCLKYRCLFACTGSA